jgi:hypothetical protein
MASKSCSEKGLPCLHKRRGHGCQREQRSCRSEVSFRIGFATIEIPQTFGSRLNSNQYRFYSLQRFIEIVVQVL